MSENGDDAGKAVITVTVFADQRLKIDCPPTLMAETVVAMLERAANYYKMQLVSTMVVEKLRALRDEDRLRGMIRK